MTDVTIGRTFRMQLQWRFLNLLHLPFGPDADRISRERYEEVRGHVGRGLELVLDPFGELTSDEIEHLRVGLDVLNSLSDDVLPALRGLLDSGVPPSAPELLVWRELEGSDASFASLRDEVVSWTAHWNLDAEWMRNVALQTVALWARDAVLHEARVWELPPFDVYLTPEESIDLPPWSYASGEGLNAYRKRAREQVLADLDRYVEQLRATAENEGFPAEARELQVESYIYTIRHQLGGEAQNRIAEDVGKDKSRVGKNIRTLLDLIEIPTRVRGKH